MVVPSQVRFSGTDVPALDERRFRLKTLNSFQLMLVDDSTELLPLDTSIGRIRLKPLRGFLKTGFWRCPLLVWCLLLVAAVLGLASQLRFALLLLVCGSGLGAGAVGFALRQRRGGLHKLGELRNCIPGLNPPISPDHPKREDPS